MVFSFFILCCGRGFCGLANFAEKCRNFCHCFCTFFKIKSKCRNFYPFCLIVSALSPNPELNVETNAIVSAFCFKMHRNAETLQRPINHSLTSTPGAPAMGRKSVPFYLLITPAFHFLPVHMPGRCIDYTFR